MINMQWRKSKYLSNILDLISDQNKLFISIYLLMSYEYNNSKILGQQQIGQNHSLNSQQLELQVRSLEDQIEFTVANYQSLLQLEKKNSADRSQFLLFLIQTTRTRQQEELQTLKVQLESAMSEKEEAHSLEKQMQTIGEGVDSIVEEGKKLKSQNESLQKELEEQEAKERQLDQELSSCQKELQGYRQKIDEWQRTKIKWNRRKKELLEIIAGAQKQITIGRLEAMHEEDADMEQDHLHGLLNKYNPKEAHSN